MTSQLLKKRRITAPTFTRGIRRSLIALLAGSSLGVASQPLASAQAPDWGLQWRRSSQAPATQAPSSQASAASRTTDSPTLRVANDEPQFRTVQRAAVGNPTSHATQSTPQHAKAQRAESSQFAERGSSSRVPSVRLVQGTKPLNAAPSQDNAPALTLPPQPDTNELIPPASSELEQNNQLRGGIEFQPRRQQPAPVLSDEELFGPPPQVLDEAAPSRDPILSEPTVNDPIVNEPTVSEPSAPSMREMLRDTKPDPVRQRDSLEPAADSAVQELPSPSIEPVQIEPVQIEPIQVDSVPKAAPTDRPVENESSANPFNDRERTLPQDRSDLRGAQSARPTRDGRSREDEYRADSPRYGGGTDFLDPTAYSCDDFRKRIAEQTIDKVSLDISPPFRPDEFDQDRFERLKADFDEKQVIRQWVGLDGRPLATGRLRDLAYEKVVIELEDGSLQRLPVQKLSEGDIAYVTENWGLPRECLIEQVAFTPRAWTPTTMTWKASNLCHSPLYFEDVNLERYGHTHGPVLEPFIQSAHFFTNIAVLPYKMGVHPPCECQYTLGYYRPGNCAPWIKPPVPISARGAIAQAATMTGLFWLIP